MYYFNIKRLMYPFAVVITAWVTQASAQNRTVDVDLVIKEPRCIAYYEPEGIKAIEEQGAIQLAARMQSYLPFIQFSGNTGIHKLVFTVDREKEVGIYSIHLLMQLQLNNGAHYNTTPYVFRSAADFDAPLPDDYQGFIGALDNALDTWLSKEQSAIINDVFSNVSLGEKAHPIKSSQAWALPFSTETHKIGYHSEFLIKSEYTDNVAEWELLYPVEAKGRVLSASPTCPAEYVGNLMAAMKDLTDVDKINRVSVKGIYLTKYIKPESVTLPPDDNDL
ncbi:MAG: hypothetical protein DIU61_008315 [Bacteroidota bacterium]|jgi:hypothetical protein|nr:MAG: hypothetical protein DIU61_04180 [Bacteroidota bacterium]